MAQAATGGDATGQQQPDWHFDIAVYGWLSAINVDIMTSGQDEDFTIPFSDLVERTKAGFQSRAEVGWRRWFFVFDGTWATLGGEYSGQIFDLDVELKQRIFDLHLGYGVYRHALLTPHAKGKKSWLRVSAVDVYVGARYFGTETTVKEVTHLTGNEHESSSDVTRWDPFFGARGAHSLSNRWLVELRGDIGGFGIGNAARFTYQVSANAGFRLSHLFALYGGYRVLGYDLGEDAQNGSDITQFGPQFGIAVSF
jgi:hypothetical protein